MHHRGRHEDEHHKKRKRSRSRSKEKSRKRESHRPKDKKRKIDDSDRRGQSPSVVEDVSAVGDSGTAESLSIEETNKLRAKLGLAPLDLGNDSTADGDGNKPKNSDTDFVHAPAKDITKAKQTEKLMEKIATQREKRELLNKLREVQSLGSGEDISTISWVEKMRAKEKAKQEAEKREKMLAELDEEFGISAVVAEQIKPKKAKKEYSETSLAGLRVEHSVERISEGSQIILTLKDSDVLAEDAGDVLTNVNLEDEEKAEKNRENRRKMAGLGGIVAEEDEDVLMGLREKGILEKYDVEIEGPKKTGFTLEANGTYATDHERALQRLQEELQGKRQSLGDHELQPAAEFYTPDEMAQFKKKRKTRKVQRRVLRADDLMQDAGALATASADGDHGSRSRRGAGSGGQSAKSEAAAEEEGEVVDVAKTEADTKPSNGLAALTGLDPAIAALLTVQTIPQPEDQVDEDEDMEDKWIAEPLEPDDMQLELERTLNRVRNANLAKPIPAPEERLQLLLKEEESVVPKPESGSSNGGGLVFDSTAEFFKQISGGLQSDVTAKMVKREAEETEALAEGEDVAGGSRSRSSKDNERKDRYQRDSGSRHYKHSSSRRREDEKASSSKSYSGSSRDGEIADPPQSALAPTAASGSGVFEEEPTLNQGVFSALLLAQRKGYIEEEKEAERPVGQLVNLMAKHYVKEEMRYDDIDAKFAKRERYTGPLSEFREKPGYRPEVRLHYVDELGRNLSAKEAFRQLSHKFHGKGSGKKKTEKRAKKILEEAIMKNSVGADTPLGTLDKLNKKLEKQGTPYVVLSGKGSVTKSLMK